MILDLVGGILLAGGAGFALIGSVGVIRLPDFYCRTHAASKLDTLALGLSMVGLALLNGFDLNAVKLLLIVAFVAVANPAAASTLGRAAIRARLVPWVRPRQRPEDTA